MNNASAILGRSHECVATEPIDLNARLLRQGCTTIVESYASGIWTPNGAVDRLDDESEKQRGSPMFDWLMKNKEWVFSGVGVPLITALVVISYRSAMIWPKRLLESKSGANPKQAPESTHKPPLVPQPEQVASLPTGNEIALIVDNAPPFQRDQVGSNYVGLAVSWPVVFFGLAIIDKPRCIVILSYGYETWGAKIHVILNINDYPRLKTIAEPSASDKSSFTHGWIEGTITKCGCSGMEINPFTLKFFD